MLGVSPDPARPGDAVNPLAEILGAVVLAGELSLMAAFTSNDLARAHEKLGRGVQRRFVRSGGPADPPARTGPLRIPIQRGPAAVAVSPLASSS